MTQVAVLAQVDIDPACKEAFDARARRHSADSQANEEGCLMFQVNTVDDDPNRYVMYEIYADKDAIETHMNSAHMKAFRSDTADMVKDRVITILNVVTELRRT